MKYVLLIMILLVGCSTTPAEPTPIPTIVPTAISAPGEAADVGEQVFKSYKVPPDYYKTRYKEEGIEALINAFGREFIKSCIEEEIDIDLSVLPSPGTSEYWAAEHSCREEVEKAIDWESLEQISALNIPESHQLL